MKDFCNVAERDCIRLIIAQDLKESGIDVDSSNIGNFSTTINTSYSTNNSSHTCHHSQHHHNQHHHSLNLHNNRTQHHLSTNKNILNTSMNNTTRSNIIDLNNQHDSHIVTSTRVFGVDFRQLEMVNTGINEQILTVPSFLKFSIEYISEYLHIEGIFRRNGTASRLKELKKQAEEGVYNFSQFAIFDLTSLVKLFFRELPESLLTFALYSHFIKAVKLESTNSKLESILNLCLQLPDINLHVLIYLMNFLKKITLQESLNKMNSFNLAVCFAPNIIYTRINKSNDLYINEERIVVQLLIENSSMIGKISDSVYERSVMLNSLCCSTSNPNCSVANNTTSNNPKNNDTNNNTFNSNPNAISNNNDLMFLYDNDLQENSSFAHHIQSAGSTSLSSYCGSSSSNSKKEKKKRRSSSLKELMNTIQNSISKFRRRSASEKNDKTTYSIITCTSMTSASSSTNCGDTTSCSNRFEDKQKLIDTPFINASNSGKQMSSNFYATPRINKRNAEDSLQSTTKKKLMEKLPQRNLLLPNAPITPFSNTKKSKHPFKQLLTASEKPFKFENIISPDIRFAEAASSSLLPNQPPSQNQDKGSNSQSNQSKTAISSDPSQSTHKSHQTHQTPLILNQKQLIQQTPSTLTSSNQPTSTASNNPNLHKQLKYEDSPSSLMINQSCDLASHKPKYQHHIEKNMSLVNDLSNECRRRLELIPNHLMTTSSCSSKHHHGHSHHHHHKHSSSSKEHHHHHHHHSSDRKKQHQYVNAIPPNLLASSHRSNRFINQSDLCTQIISGNLNTNKSSSDQNLQSNDCSSSSSSSSSGSGSDKHHKSNGASVSICTSSLQQNTTNSSNFTSADNSMRCTLKRGRPNTPKTGLSVDYRIRKSSVPNTPECKNIPMLNTRANNTISNDDIQSRVKSSVSSASLNTAMVLDNDDENADKISIVTTNSACNIGKENCDDLNDARLLDIAFNGDEEDEDEDEEEDDETEFDSDENVCEIKIETEDLEQSRSRSNSSSRSASPKLSRNRHLSVSVSLQNLHECDKHELASNSNLECEVANDLVLMRRKSLSADVLIHDADEQIEVVIQDPEMSVTNDQVEATVTKNPIIEEQQKMIHFEPFEFKPPSFSSNSSSNNNNENFKAMLDHQQKLIDSNENMLQSCLRRQSLFKLKETINGKVSKQVTEIEQRKLSPYRFSNSPLKLKKFKDSSSSLLNSGRVSKSGISPVRVPSIFCKKILEETPREQYIMKSKTGGLNESSSSPQKKTESPLIGKACNRFFRQMSRNRSVKRLSSKMSNQVGSNLSSISENESGMLSLVEDKKPVGKAQPISSPIGKNLILSKELMCSTETFDL